jgi:thiol-disulfide isomerase/thioredoxin
MRLLLPVVCLALTVPPTALAATLTGVGPAGAAEWSRPLPSEGAGTPLTADRWAPRLPDLSIPLLGGGTFRTSEQRGKVVILDVWASWCAPCKIELPHMQALAAAESGRGLVAIAVNAQEPEALVARAAKDFNITLPVGLYDGSLDEALAVRSLPAVFLLDRQGRLRGRWDGYRMGIEHEIGARARALLEEGPGGSPERFGDVLSGASSLQARFWRDLPAPASGIAAVPRAEGGARLILHVARGLLSLEPDGTMSAGPALAATGGRLLAADVDGIGTPEIVHWGRARPDVVVIDLAGGTPRALEAPGPVLDVAVLPGGTVLLATPDALVTVNRLGAVAVVPGSGGASGLAVRGTEVWAIDAGASHRPRRFAVEGESVVPREPLSAESWPPWAFTLAPAGPAFVVAPVDTDLTPGSFTGRDRAEIAVRYGRSDVAVLDARTGEVRFAARLNDPIAQLAAADLDGDGIDELALTAGGGLLVLGRPPG